jgi:hypothetical protein
MSTASNVTLRTDIGRPLYYEEVDTNFQELKYVIVESNDHIASTTAHDASDIVYSNANLSASNVEEALNALGVKNNLSATSDPTVNNDSSEGYAAFSRWVNTSTTECFLCLDSVNGAAVWVKSSLTLDELGTAALVDMGVNPSQIRTNTQNETLFLSETDVGSAAFVDMGVNPSQIRTNAENDQTFVKATVIFDALSSEATGDGAALISMEGGPTVEDAVLSKANQATTYTETEVDNLLDDKADKATTYTETEVDGLIATRTESPDETTVTGTATFTNSDNNIALTGIGSIGLEIGDVVQVTGTASNNKLFTVEVITDSGNVIVNQAHAGGTTIKSLVDETVSATVTLVAKWFNAPIGLGQGWVAPSRSPGVTYTNNTLRAMSVNVQAPTNSNRPFTIDGLIIGLNSERTVRTQWNPIIPPESTYSFAVAGTTLTDWTELR